MRRLLFTLGIAGACASGLLATGASAAVLDGPLAARAAVIDAQGVEQAAWVCRYNRWRGPHRRCFRAYGGPYSAPYYAYGGPYSGGPAISFGFGFGGGGHRWHHW